MVAGEGLVDEVGQPIGQRRGEADDFLGAPADHPAEGGIDVDDAVVEVAGAHADGQALLHGAAQRLGLAETLFRRETAAVMAHESEDRDDRDDGQAEDGGDQ